MSDNIERSLQMLSTALEMERKGKTFYDEAISTCQNEVGREMFRMLMKDEVVHMDQILKIYEALKAGGAWSDEWKSIRSEHKDLRELFREMVSDHGTRITSKTSDLEALEVGIDFESRAISFYQEHLEKATDSLEREFIEQIISEEKSHHAALSDMKLYLSDPAAWFVEQEHPGLDGA
jgi:rubrerythrin